MSARPIALAAAILLIGVPASLLAQETFTFRTDFQDDQKFDYRMAGTSTLVMPDQEDQTTRIEAEYSYHILSADEEEFTITSKIRNLRIETPDEVLRYGANAADAPLYLTAMVEAVNSIRVTYDSKWNIVRVRGFGRFLEKMLDRGGEIPGRLGDLIGPVVETILGPIATAIVRDQGSEEFPGRLFQAGTVRPGDEWSSLQDSELLAMTRRTWKVDEIATEGAHRVCRTTATLDIDYKGLLGLIGYRSQEATSRTTFLASGLPAAANTTMEVTLARPEGAKISSRFETRLVELGAPTEGASGPDDLRRRLEEARSTGDIATMIEILRQMVEAEPKNAENWLALAQAIESQGMQLGQEGTTPEAAKLFISAATAFRRYIELDPAGEKKNVETASYIFYNEACGLALTGKPDEAVMSLEKAIQAGFTDLEHIETDPDLTTIRELEAFKKLIAAIPDMTAKATSDRVKTALAEFKTFAFDFNLKDLDGTMRSLADYKGKVLIVDFWGTWCPPCRREIPHFVALHKQLHDQGLEIVGLTYEGVDEAEARRKVTEFAKENGIPYTLTIGDKPTQDQVPDFRGYPTTLFIDRTGKVRLAVVGYQEEAFLQEVAKTLLEEETD